jgi:hypothetical protein
MKSFFERWPKPPLDNRSAAQASGNEAEMGAFNFLQQPQRRANPKIRLSFLLVLCLGQ